MKKVLVGISAAAAVIGGFFYFAADRQLLRDAIR